MFRKHKACLDDLSRSLNSVLFGERGHAKKLDAYRDNLRCIANESPIELGFLIEFHTDFRDLYLNTSSKIRKLDCG